jgi:hypothetical protein
MIKKERIIVGQKSLQQAFGYAAIWIPKFIENCYERIEIIEYIERSCVDCAMHVPA